MSDPWLSTDPSWVLRTAQQSRVCTACDDHIRPGRRYWYIPATGDMWCCDCPPEGQEEVDLCAD